VKCKSCSWYLTPIEPKARKGKCTHPAKSLQAYAIDRAWWEVLPSVDPDFGCVMFEEAGKS
jgi:hypothetical protein